MRESKLSMLLYHCATTRTIKRGVQKDTQRGSYPQVCGILVTRTMAKTMVTVAVGLW